jgi:hypothetical protein
MQKVRSIRTAYKITISHFSLLVLFAIACASYLVFEEGSPFVQTVYLPFYFQTFLISLSLFLESHLISFP